MPSRKRLLLINDDKSARALMEKILVREGYHAHMAPTPDEALLLLREVPEIGIAMIEGRRAGAAVADTVAAIRAERPNLPCIVFMGFGEESELLPQGLPPGCELLRRPFKVPDLLDVLDRHLGERK